MVSVTMVELDRSMVISLIVPVEDPVVAGKLARSVKSNWGKVSQRK